jgi:beta-galactosidase
LPDVPAAKPVITIPAVKLTQSVSLLNTLPAAKENISPLTFEDLHQDYGFVLYRTVLNGSQSGQLKLKELRDYAVIMINGKKVGTLDRRLNQDSLYLKLPAGKVTLDILIENLGRINFGKYLLQNKKGITQQALLNGKILQHWKMYSLPFHDLSAVKFSAARQNAQSPIIRKGGFKLDKLGDTYLDMSNWGKGVVWVNGHNLGRYWGIGPQQTLYLPVEWLKKGYNDVEVLELLKPERDQLAGVDKPILDVVKP